MGRWVRDRKDSFYPRMLLTSREERSKGRPGIMNANLTGKSKDYLKAGTGSNGLHTDQHVQCYLQQQRRRSLTKKLQCDMRRPNPPAPGFGQLAACVDRTRRSFHPSCPPGGKPLNTGQTWTKIILGDESMTRVTSVLCADCQNGKSRLL